MDPNESKKVPVTLGTALLDFGCFLSTFVLFFLFLVLPISVFDSIYALRWSQATRQTKRGDSLSYIDISMTSIPAM